MKRKVIRKKVVGEPMPCIFCGFATMKGLATAMRPTPSGSRYHVNRDVCNALQHDEKLRKEVIELYGEPASVSTAQ